MQEGQLRMTQPARDRLVALNKARKKLITQGDAGAELGGSNSAGAAAAGGIERARRQSGGPRTARKAVEPADRREDRKPGVENFVGAGVRRVRADAGL